MHSENNSSRCTMQPVTISGVDDDDAPHPFTLLAKRAEIRKKFEGKCPPKYRDSDWSHPNLLPFRPQIDRVLAWRPEEPKGLFLRGETGRGKTRSAWALLDRLSSGGVDFVYFHSTEFFEKLSEQISYGRSDANRWITGVASLPVVFIDEFGRDGLLKSQEAWAADHFLYFIEHRLSHDLSGLILTTNLTAADIAEQQGAQAAKPLIRRLTELCEVIQFE